MPAPYDQTYAAGGERYFDAPMPAWAKIGQLFEELSKAYYDFEYSPEHLQAQRELIAALQSNLPAVQADPKAWAKAEKDLLRRFGERYTTARNAVLGPISEYFASGQMPAGEFLEWMICDAKSRLAREGDPQTDWDALETERQALVRRLEAAGYTTQRDIQMQQEDPQRYEFLQKSLGLMSQAMQNPGDEKAIEEMIVQQMKLLEQSPYYAQAQQQMDEMLKGLEAIKQSDPELYEQQRAQVDAVGQMFSDPAGAMQKLFASMGDDSDEDESDEEPAIPALPPGVLRFACRHKKVTPAQRKLFQSLQNDAQKLLPQIEKALRDMHGWMNQHSGDDPREAVLFPPDPTKSDVPLQAFTIERVELDSQGRWAILWLDTLFPHFDEHACGIRIEGGQVTRYGSWDEVCGDDEGEDEEGDE